MTCIILRDFCFSGQKAGGQELVGGLDCTVHRNFFGSQVDLASFCSLLSVDCFGNMICSILHLLLVLIFVD